MMRRVNGTVYGVMALVALLFSAIFHEQWHARAALWLGDPTARDQNRLSWNPIVHIDPFMTILLPILTWLTMGLPFGGAKPVPIQSENMRNPALGLAIASAAGPLSNLFLAVCGFGVTLLACHTVPDFLFVGEQATYNAVFLFVFVLVNTMLAAFNILPLPGLDGSRILRWFLPRGGRAILDSLEPYALIITFMLLRAGIGGVLRPVINLMLAAYGAAFPPEFLVALGSSFR